MGDNWRAEMAVTDGVPTEVDALRARLTQLAASHDDSETVDAIAHVRAALDRLALSLVRVEVLRHSAHGERRPGLRSHRSTARDDSSPR